MRWEAHQTTPSKGTSTTPVERPFTASQAWSQQMSSQENPDDTILPEENLTEYPDISEIHPRSPPITIADPHAKISNLELRTALLALA